MGSHRHLVVFLFLLLSTPNPGRAAENPYPPGPDSVRQEGVPHGDVVKGTFIAGTNSVFPGTVRDYSLYIPQQLDRSRRAPLLVLQDGGGYQAVHVLDNLIAKREIPAQIGLFVMHGRVPSRSTNALDRFNRSYEYDGLGDTYARFLLDEFFPFIEQNHGVLLTTNANERAIGGASSGGICAFTAAWERPDAFRRVFTSIGTYVGLRGGHSYPTLIRKVEPKPIRIFLQGGENDLNIYGGDWWMANQEMQRALEFAGYDVRHAWGTGGHDSFQATQVFPDALRWLWRDDPAPITANPEGRSKQPVVREILAPDSEWELVAGGFGFTEGPAVNAAGEVFFTDIPNQRIHRVDANGAVSVFASETGGANGLMFGPDGRLFAAAGGSREIAVYTPDGVRSVLTTGIEGNDLCVTHNGHLYVTEPSQKRVWLVTPDGEKRVVDEGINFPNGVRLSPDQSLLFVSDTRGAFVWSFQVQDDGSLAYKQRYHYLHLVDGSTQSGADGMTLDRDGRLYVTTEMGLQFCDQAGRVNGIVSKPQPRWLSNVVLGGPEFDQLYVTCADKVYRRPVRVRGLDPAKPPLKPAPPRL